MKPQTAAVLALLREFGEGGVTPSEARDIVGTDRLAARIAELRAEGYAIDTKNWTTPGSRKHVARYVLVGYGHIHGWETMRHPITGDTYRVCPCGLDENVSDPPSSGLTVAEGAPPSLRNTSPAPRVAETTHR